jgi:hypothetical protein
MSRTTTTRRAGTALAATALFTAVLAAGASTASAKSELDIGTRAGTVSAGSTVRVHASGNTDDFAGLPVQLCVDRRGSTGSWHRLRCTSAYRLTVDVPAARRGVLAFRAQLIAETGHHRQAVDRTSGTLLVTVR